MKLTYRGNSYEKVAPIQPASDSTDRPKIKLIYRGHPYDYTPPPAVISEAVEVDTPTVTLIYRGNTYERKLQHKHQAPQCYQKPHTINWRYQTGEG